MKVKRVISVDLQRKLRALGNPYAKLQICPEVEQLELGYEEDTERRYVRNLQNPYAGLSVYVNSAAEKLGTSLDDRQQGSAEVHKISKEQFRIGCRRVFRMYIPTADKGRLRAHHRDFISRNETRVPAARYLILRELQKYDISAHAIITAQFNREDYPLTESKLRAIEKTVENGE